MEYRTLNPNEFNQWLDHCVYVFNEGKYSESFRYYFKNHFINDPYADFDSIFVAMDGEEIAATVRLFYRDIYLNGKKIKTGGIGEVSTKPQYRGMGLATNLLNMAINKMEEKSINVSLLFASRHTFYNMFDYQLIETPINIVEVNKDQKIFDIQIRDTEFSWDLKDIMNIYETYSSKFNSTVVRTEDYWQNWVRQEYRNSLVALDNNKIIGYIFYDVGNERVNIKEFGFIDNVDKSLIFDAFLQNIANKIEREKSIFTFPSVIKSNYASVESDFDKSKMYRLVKSFELNGKLIDTNQKLIDVLKTDKLLFWSTDGY
ncbi:GNAT family N-acetyltransferase [Caldicellulosiruptoraceae bacterium PP1]